MNQIIKRYKEDTQFKKDVKKKHGMHTMLVIIVYIMILIIFLQISGRASAYGAGEVERV
jgi:cell division protein FtsB